MKKNKWIYWIVTGLLSLQMIFTGIVDLIVPAEMVDNLTRLGVPTYLMPFLGVLKILGIITILFIKNEHLKIGAYAGILFYGLGIVYIHIAFGDPVTNAFPGLIFILFNLASYFYWMKVTANQKSPVLT